MQNVVRNLSFKLATRRPGHDTEAGSMAGTTINASSHFIGSSSNIQPPMTTSAPTYRAPARGVVPSTGMRGALYTNNMRLIVEYREPMHKERMQYDPSNPNEPQVCFQLPLPTEFKPGALISMFILGEPVCAIIQEVSPDNDAEDGEARISTGRVEWEHGEPYVDGEQIRGIDVLHTQDDHDTRLAAAEHTQTTPATQLSPNRKVTPNSNSSLPRNTLATRKPSLISWLKGPISFFRRTRVAGPNGRYRESVVVYPDFQRASVAEGGIERMLLGVDGRPVEGNRHEDASRNEHGHAPGDPDSVIAQPDGNTSLLTLAAKKIQEHDDARIESWAEKHPHRSFPPLSAPAPAYPTFSAIYGGDTPFPHRSESASPVLHPESEHRVSSRFRESFEDTEGYEEYEETLKIKYSDSPPPASLLQNPRLSFPGSPQRQSGVASPIPSPAVSIPRHPGAAQATLQRRDTQNSRRSERRSEDAPTLKPVRRHASTSTSAQRPASQRRETSLEASARVRARAQAEADLEALQKHISSPVSAPPTRTRQRSLSASGIRNFIGNALSRLSNTPASATPNQRPRASSMTETASVASKRLPEITVGETDSWRETFAPFKPSAVLGAPTLPLLPSRDTKLRLPLYRTGSSSNKGRPGEIRTRPSPLKSSPVPGSPSPSYTAAPAPSYAAHSILPGVQIRASPFQEPTLQSPPPFSPPQRPSPNLAHGRTPSTYTPMFPHLPSARNRNATSTLTAHSSTSRMTTGSTHAVRQSSRNESKQKPLPVSPNIPVGVHHPHEVESGSGSESDGGYGGTWKNYASPDRTKPLVSPTGARDRPTRPSLPPGASSSTRVQEPIPQSEGTQHTRFIPNISGQSPPRPQPPGHGQSHSVAPIPSAMGGGRQPRRLTPMPNLTSTRTAGYTYDNLPEPYISPISPSRPQPPDASRGRPRSRSSPQSPSPPRLPGGMALSSSDSTAAAESTFDGYHTAPSIPSISDAFDKSSYRADSRSGADHQGHSDDDDDDEANSDASETISEAESEESEAPDSDSDREVDTTRYTHGSWAIPVGDIDANGNERAAILSGSARVYVARPRDQPPAVQGSVTGPDVRTRPPAHAVFDAAAIATRPLRPNPPRTLPTGDKRF